MKDILRTIKLGSVNRGLTILVIGLSFAFPIFSLLEPYIIKKIFDLIEISIRSGAGADIFQQLTMLLVMYAGLIVSEGALSQVHMIIMNKWWSLTRIKLTDKVFTHLESLSISYFERNSTGKIKERVDRGIGDMNSIMELILMDLAPQVFFILAATIILLRTNIYLGLILLSGIPLYVLIYLRFLPRVTKFTDKMRDLNEHQSAVITESIINVKTIKSYATEKQQISKVGRILRRAKDALMGYTYSRAAMNVLRTIVVNIIQFSILGLGAYWTLKGEMTLGTLTLAWQYSNRSIQPLWWMMRALDETQKELRTVRRVFELLDTDPEITDREGAKNLKLSRGVIGFKNVHFSYPDKTVLKGINLTVPAGKTLALVGHSGSGKSTLVKLLLRFYDLNSGSISIDDQNISQVKQKSLRDRIGVVMQDSILFNDTVLRNISYGTKGTGLSDAVAAAKVANAHDFITRLPKGYQTVVGERGVKLSGGEQQRINIARAVLKNPPILVLDEATSSLDSENEKLIQDALWKLIKGRTTIVIAHRLSTVMRADLIAVMDKGRIVELDTHAKLVKNRGGIYENLFKIQSGGYLTDETI
jgi:ABC-type multidrug transport system fused ATPase/permease subunit